MVNTVFILSEWILNVGNGVFDIEGRVTFFFPTNIDFEAQYNGIHLHIWIHACMGTQISYKVKWSALSID